MKNNKYSTVYAYLKASATNIKGLSGQLQLFINSHNFNTMSKGLRLAMRIILSILFIIERLNFRNGLFGLLFATVYFVIFVILAPFWRIKEVSNILNDLLKHIVKILPLVDRRKKVGKVTLVTSTVTNITDNINYDVLFKGFDSLITTKMLKALFVMIFHMDIININRDVIKTKVKELIQSFELHPTLGGILTSYIIDIIVMLQEVITSDDDKKEYCVSLFFSILYIYRILDANTPIDLSTIIDPLKDKERFDSILTELFKVEDIEKYLNTLISEVDKSKLLPYLMSAFKPKLYATTTASPNTRSNYTGIFIDSLGVKNSPDLMKNLERLAELLGPDGLYIIKLFHNTLSDKFKVDEEKSKNACSSRLTSFLALGGKRRYIAIFDWVSQSLLYTFHNLIFALLRNIKSDCTFNHDRPIKHFRAFGVPKFIVSIDLTAATDRLPIMLQKIVLFALLSRLLGLENAKEMSELWAAIMTERDFRVDATIINSMTPEQKKSFEGKPIRYLCGQPMGGLSSWALLALTHHIILIASGANTKDYYIIGDDLIITNKDVYLRYLFIMNALGVTVNTEKTIVSEGTLTLEFAKRFVFQGLFLDLIRYGEMRQLFKANSLHQTITYIFNIIKDFNPNIAVLYMNALLEAVNITNPATLVIVRVRIMLIFIVHNIMKNNNWVFDLKTLVRLFTGLEPKPEGLMLIKEAIDLFVFELTSKKTSLFPMISQDILSNFYRSSSNMPVNLLETRDVFLNSLLGTEVLDVNLGLRYMTLINSGYLEYDVIEGYSYFSEAELNAMSKQLMLLLLPNETKELAERDNSII